MKNSYPTFYKLAYARGKENSIPATIRKKIPKQTKSNWRRLSDEDIQEILKDEYAREEYKFFIKDEAFDQLINRRLIIGLIKIIFLLVNAIGKNRYYKLLFKHKDELIRIVEYYQNYIDKNLILKCLKLATQKYETWLIQSQYNCESSIIALCAKRYANQTTEKEYNLIKESLEDEDFKHWPKSAIHAQMKKTGKLMLARSTFYKISNLLDPTISERKKGRKQKKEILKANRINEYWHLDLSYFRTMDGERHYIYAIIDRYSRKILSWAVYEKVKSKYASLVLLEALGIENPETLDLISDGGPENKGKHIKLILEEYKLNNEFSEIVHKIALKDIDYSNSMIERFFSIMKSGYLYLEKIENKSELLLIINRLIHEYNFIRPHHSHNLLTPHEVHIGRDQPNLNKQMIQAQKKRLFENKNCSCKVCTCGIR